MAPPPSSPGVRRTLIERRPNVDQPDRDTALGLVLDGSFESAFANEAPVVVHAGQGFVDQARVTHQLFRNASADQPLRFVVAYTLRAGEQPTQILP